MDKKEFLQELLQNAINQRVKVEVEQRVANALNLENPTEQAAQLANQSDRAAKVADLSLRHIRALIAEVEEGKFEV